MSEMQYAPMNDEDKRARKKLLERLVVGQKLTILQGIKKGRTAVFVREDLDNPWLLGDERVLTGWMGTDDGRPTFTWRNSWAIDYPVEKTSNWTDEERHEIDSQRKRDNERAYSDHVLWPTPEKKR